MLRKIYILMALPLALWLSGCASMPKNALAGAEAAERAKFDAMGRNDVDAIGRFLADDLVFCHSNGRCDNKEQYLKFTRETITKPTTVTVNSLRPRQVEGVVLIHGDVVFHVKATEPPMELKLKYTSVWVYRDGRWQMTAWQSTRLP